MKKIVNPNRPFNEGQVEQLVERLGDVQVVEASCHFPLAADGGLAGAAYASAQGYPDDMDYWYPTGFATGAGAILATLHGRFFSQFPDILVFGGPPDFPFLGVVCLNDIRQEARETRYEAEEIEPVSTEVLVLNFSHPITEEQGEEIAKLLKLDSSEITIVENLSRHYKYESAEELVEAVQKQIAEAKLSATDWQERRIIVNLPAHSGGAAILLADLHGRMGYFPTALRVERADDGFHFTEAVDLEALRLKALEVRAAGDQMVTVRQEDLEALLGFIVKSSGEVGQLASLESFQRLASAIDLDI